ncbi:S1 family peptidase [Actinosynnema sp. NPDC050436]|uniref:S1 family peptidase n=1 Tax=Actinosynnema sp. NPDC050436 TaxID=3155659 RepID=UPI0033CB1D4F
MAFAVSEELREVVDEKGALGFYHDERRNGFVVVLPASGPGSTRTAADFAVRGTTPAVTRSRTTRAEVDAVDARIRARARQDPAGHVYGSVFDLARDVVVVTSDAPPDVLEPLSAGLSVPVEHRYGGGGRDSRQNDPRPFRGGAAITVGSGKCTSGFTVADPDGNRYLLTAGHCGYVPGVPIGRPVQNTGSGQFMGNFYNWNFPDRDLALVGTVQTGYYGREIYVGDATGKTIRVAGAADPVVGRGDLCRSGAATYEKCGHRVVNTTGQLCTGAGCTRNLITYDKGTAPQEGDSGAPFYTYNGDRSAVVVHGIHVGRSGSLYFAEKWSLIASSQGVSVVTQP